MNKSTHLDLPLRVNPVKGVEKQREELRNVQEKDWQEEMLSGL